MAILLFSIAICLMTAVMIRREEKRQWKISKDTVAAECNALRKRCWDYEHRIDELEREIRLLKSNKNEL